ncbi:MAG: ROK family glucokinase [Butyricicoccus sp.]
MKSYAFGVDLGGTTVKIGLFTRTGELVEKWEIPTRTENQSNNLLSDIAESLLDKLGERGISLREVNGVGLGVPGAVIDEHFVEPCVNLNKWGGEVAERLSELCGLPVKVVNDANAAALGEMSQGGGKGHKNIVFVTLGTGVGGGVIVNGKLIAGVHGAGGEIGHIKVAEPNDMVCGCGKSGCLEQYASATGLVKQAARKLAQSDKPTKLTKYRTLTCKDIFQCAKEGDAIALELVDLMTKMLGKALATVSSVCDPDIFVIGGGVSRAGDIILDGVRKHFIEYAFPASSSAQFALAELGNDAGMYGAVQLVRD